MKLTVTPSAIETFKNDWGFQEGEFARIFIRYAGGGPDPFTFGVMKDKPRYPAFTLVVGGITFYIEEDEEWYLKDSALTIDGEREEIIYKIDNVL